MLTNNAAYKYESTNNMPFVITQCWTNVMVTFSMVRQKNYNIRYIKPYKSDTNIEYTTPENTYDGVNI